MKKYIVIHRHPYGVSTYFINSNCETVEKLCNYFNELVDFLTKEQGLDYDENVEEIIVEPIDDNFLDFIV